MIVPTIMLHFLHTWRSEVPIMQEQLSVDLPGYVILASTFAHGLTASPFASALAARLKLAEKNNHPAR
jgi:hypothetical protein